jgi:hypothetical protein
MDHFVVLLKRWLWSMLHVILLYIVNIVRRFRQTKRPVDQSAAVQVEAFTDCKGKERLGNKTLRLKY